MKNIVQMEFRSSESPISKNRDPNKMSFNSLLSAESPTPRKFFIKSDSKMYVFSKLRAVPKLTLHSNSISQNQFDSITRQETSQNITRLQSN